MHTLLEGEKNQSQTNWRIILTSSALFFFPLNEKIGLIDLPKHLRPHSSTWITLPGPRGCQAQWWSRVLSHLSRSEKALCYPPPLHCLAPGAARLPGRCARLWFYFTGCKLSRKPVSIGKCSLKKKSVLPVVLSTGLHPVWGSTFQVPLPPEWGRREVLRAAQLWEPLCYSEWEKNLLISVPLHDLHSGKLMPVPWEQHLHMGVACKALRPCNLTHLWGTTLSMALSPSLLSWGWGPWCFPTPALVPLTLRESYKDWSRDIPSSAHQI